MGQGTMTWQIVMLTLTLCCASAGSTGQSNTCVHPCALSPPPYWDCENGQLKLQGGTPFLQQLLRHNRTGWAREGDVVPGGALYRAYR